MTVYLGKNPVGVGRIVEKKVAKEKLGCSVDNLLGDVDSDGNYVAPSEPFEVNLAGVKSVGRYGLSYRFSRTAIAKFTADDLVSCGEYSFENSLSFCNSLTEVSIANLEIVNSNNAFKSAFAGNTYLTKTKFAKLKIINGNNAFDGCFSAAIGMYNATPDEVFPALEEVKGTLALTSVFNMAPGKTYIFSKVKKMTGNSSSKYSSIFGGLYTKDTVWRFPSATEFTGYIWYSGGTSYTGEIHFAAENQAAIEACEGYDYKWGFDGATIYFDL